MYSLLSHSNSFTFIHLLILLPFSPLSSSQWIFITPFFFTRTFLVKKLTGFLFNILFFSHVFRSFSRILFISLFLLFQQVDSASGFMILRKASSLLPSIAQLSKAVCSSSCRYLLLKRWFSHSSSSSSFLNPLLLSLNMLIRCILLQLWLAFLSFSCY